MTADWTSGPVNNCIVFRSATDNELRHSVTFSINHGFCSARERTCTIPRKTDQRKKKIIRADVIPEKFQALIETSFSFLAGRNWGQLEMTAQEE